MNTFYIIIGSEKTFKRQAKQKTYLLLKEIII